MPVKPKSAPEGFGYLVLTRGGDGRIRLKLTERLPEEHRKGLRLSSIEVLDSYATYVSEPRACFTWLINTLDLFEADESNCKANLRRYEDSEALFNWMAELLGRPSELPQ